MRIVCPFCDAAYEVPRSLLRDDGQMVRCARCDKEWAPEPAPPAAAPVASRPAAALPRIANADTGRQSGQPTFPTNDEDGLVEVEPKPQAAGGLSERLTGRQKPPDPMAPFLSPVGSGGMRVSLLSRRMRLLTVLAWVASLAVLAAAVLTIYVRRPEIQAVWPASERLYRLLGLS